jgi:hypothetical protein
MSWNDSVFDRLLGQRIIVLGQQVDDDIANRLCAQMLLAAEDPRADIAMYINSPGGSITALHMPPLGSPRGNRTDAGAPRTRTDASPAPQ